MKLELDVNSPKNSFVNNSIGNGFNYDSSDVKEMLRSGINLSKEGNRAEARQLLLRVTEIEPSNETAWLWLASISEYPEELLIFLQNVLNINPVNERALEWAKATKTLLSKTLVQRGINASHENQKEFGKQCFLQAIVHDSENEMAWLWLASASDSTEEKISHLQKVLSIDPQNETALSSLKAVKNQMSQGLLKKANSAAIAGERATAREMLDEVMRQTPEMEEAWILQAYLTDEFYAKISCYEKVLNLNPENEAAQAGLASLKALMQKTSELKAVEPMTKSPAEVSFVEETPNDFKNDEVLETAQEEMPVEFKETEPVEFNNEPEVLEAKSEFATEELPVEFEEETVSPVQEFVQEASEEFSDDSTPVLFEDTKEWETPSQENSVSQATEEQTHPAETSPDSSFNYKFNYTENDNFLIEDTIIPNVESTKPSFYADEPSVDKNDVENQILDIDGESESFNADLQENSFQESSEIPAYQPNYFEQTAPVFNVNENISPETAQPSEAIDNRESVSDFQHAEENVVFEPVESFENSQSELTQDHISASQVADYLYTETFEENKPEVTETNSPKEFSNESADVYNLSDFSANDSNNSTFAPQETSDYDAENFETAQQISVSPSYFEALAEKNYSADQPYFEKELVAQTEEAHILEAQSFAKEETFEQNFEEAKNYQEPVEESANVSEFQAETFAEVDNSHNVQSEIVENNFSTEPIIFNCPFCQAENENLSIVCHSCRAMLTLSDLEMMLSHQEADQDVILQAIERLEIERSLHDFDDKELTDLGIAHLNAKNLRKGYAYLYEASQLNPNDVVLSSKVNFLAIRLNEIENQENKAQENPVISKTIMVVDDSPTVRKLITGKLEKCGHSVISAIDGMDALAKMNEVIPDLVLLDITMPRLDGYQVCKLIRNNEITKDIPIVMISGKDGFFDKVRGRMAGSTGYITKPFGPDTLMKTIETYIN